MDQTEHKESVLYAWVVIFLLVVIILTQGFFAFFVVLDSNAQW